MNIKRYVEMILLKLSENKTITLIENVTYKEFRKYKSYKLIIKGEKPVNFNNLTTLLEYLKEMI